MFQSDLAKDNTHCSMSIVVPVFNEEESISLFVDRVTPILRQVCETLGDTAKSEIIFIDDGSFDRTVEVISNLVVDDVSIRLIKLSRNFGKDAALAAGLAHARGDSVVPMDVDLQDPPELLPDMVREWQNGAMVVNAVRADRSSDTWFKRKAAEAFYEFVNMLSKYPVPKNVGDFRLLDKRVVEHLNAIEERIRFNKGLVAWLGYQTAEVEYSRPAREAGMTKWKVWSLWNFALDGITGSSTFPLRVWSYVGGMLALIAGVYSIVILLKTLIFGVDQPGYASLMIVVLTLGGANLVALGILGEYIGRISIEVRRRPLYLIEDIKEISDQGVVTTYPQKQEI